jgi:TolB protein
MVFMSNGGSGNYDLYLLPALGQDATMRLTDNDQRDGHPHWNPVADRLVFVSGRTGNAEVFLLDLGSGAPMRLTWGTKTHLYPQWSPDGRRIAMIYGSNENHDIYLIEDVDQPKTPPKPLVTWGYDDLRPVWSPDGGQIAFYSNYNRQNDPKVWSLMVVGTGNAGARPPAARVVAHDVVPDVERGPAWMPDSRRLVYVKNDAKAFNPLYVVDTRSGLDRPIDTATRMNHDVVCSVDGVLAFRAQVEQWDHIFTAELPDENRGGGE